MNSEERIEAIYLQYINLRAVILSMDIEYDDLYAQLDKLAATIEAAQSHIETTLEERVI